MLNLTPHTIRVYARTPEGAPDLGVYVDFAPSGVVARVTTTETPAGVLTLTNAPAGSHGGTYWNVPVVTRTTGEASGLPEAGVDCLVSSMVLAAIPGRPNTWAPDTGPSAVRDAEGRIIGVTRLIAA